MIRVRYTGPDERLQGHTALAVTSPGDPDTLSVQFEDRSLPEAFGWREAPAAHFQLVPEALEGACPSSP